MRAPAVVVLVLAAACAAPAPPSSSPSVVATASPPAQLRPPSPGVALSSPSASPPIVAQPGRPYDAEAILAAMAASRRPGGVPEELQRPETAAALAEWIWTFDGSPWSDIAAGGACGPERCTLDLAGTRPGAAGDDLYRFSVDRASGAVSPAAADLHAYPASLEPLLDAIVRAKRPELTDGLHLASARWLAPPDTGRFVLSYRSGGEEGSAALDVVVDLGAAEVVEVRD